MNRAPRKQCAADVIMATQQSRLVISHVCPCVDNGRYPAKGILHQAFTVRATIFMDGHDRLAARVFWRNPGQSEWRGRAMTHKGNDRWEAILRPGQKGGLSFTIEAWFDQWGTFHDELDKKYRAGLDVGVELQEGRFLLLAALSSPRSKLGASAGKEFFSEYIQAEDEYSVGEASRIIGEALAKLDEAGHGAAVKTDLDGCIAALLDGKVLKAMQAIEERRFCTGLAHQLPVSIERTEAGFGSWYELFPRSLTADPEGHGTFRDVIHHLPAIDAMGFDVVYFPPIHPIGETNRKGKNNRVVAMPGEPGCPYAIGSTEGGHDAIMKELGDIEDFRELVAAAEHCGIKLALDFAIQCSPDHPWLTEHPDWFQWRPDGTVRYAENPPKKYEDIVNVNFYAASARPAMWEAWRDIVLYWISEGINIFRVDNPHTKPLPFWEWLIRDVRSQHPDTLFLSEAFTRPAMMYQLAKIGFSQSYTYFIWRNTRQELTEYMTELTQSDVRDYFRPNFFVNTPDINPWFLQGRGRGAFLVRAALATTLSGSWGMYSGFELCESTPVPGREEYLDSEKYQIRTRDFSRPDNIIREITRLNAIRRTNPALHSHLNIRFHESGNDEVIFYSRFTEDRGNVILVAVNLNADESEEAQLRVPPELLAPGFNVRELMHGAAFQWGADTQHWYFNSDNLPFAVFEVVIAVP
ncbi:MAG: alpha-1,4-glucan--maltose-1-phosphate maltosyltransferase [Pseudohongiellaceae bacterium]